MEINITKKIQTIRTSLDMKFRRISFVNKYLSCVQNFIIPKIIIQIEQDIIKLNDFLKDQDKYIDLYFQDQTMQNDDRELLNEISLADTTNMEIIDYKNRLNHVKNRYCPKQLVNQNFGTLSFPNEYLEEILLKYE